MKSKFNLKLQFANAALVAVMSAGSAFAADVAKEGNYDFTSCWAGVANMIAFSKTHWAMTYEHSGTNLSNPPGGMFDKGTSRCVGLMTSFNGKNSNTTVCEAVFPDGGKLIATFTPGSDGKSVREVLAGTGMYEGMVSTGTATPLGQFPTIKPGTYQNCNRQTGTYKLK